jgi:hypothetical protein
MTRTRHRGDRNVPASVPDRWWEGDLWANRPRPAYSTLLAPGGSPACGDAPTEGAVTDPADGSRFLSSTVAWLLGPEPARRPSRAAALLSSARAMVAPQRTGC